MDTAIKPGLMTNPVMRRVLRKNEIATGNRRACTYEGVTGKTLFFLFMTLIGIAAFFIVNTWSQSHMQDVWGELISTDRDGLFTVEITALAMLVMLGALLLTVLTSILNCFVRTLLPITGTIYCIAEGYLLTAITMMLGRSYRWIGVMALTLTIVLVLVMLFLYKRGSVKISHDFGRVIGTVLLTVLLGSIVLLIMHFIPGINVLAVAIDMIMQNPIVSAVLSIGFIILACLFLVSDFDAVKKAVENHIDKKYEWMLAFGIAFTVLYLYLKIFDLLTKLKGKD